MTKRRYPSGVPVFKDVDGDEIGLVGVEVQHRWVTVWCDSCHLEHVYPPSELAPINDDARAMLAIARGSR